MAPIIMRMLLKVNGPIDWEETDCATKAKPQMTEVRSSSSAAFLSFIQRAILHQNPPLPQ